MTVPGVGETNALWCTTHRATARERVGLASALQPKPTGRVQRGENTRRGTLSREEASSGKIRLRGFVFANIRSPGTLANLRQNANVEVNVVDPFLRKGYRFKGVAAVLASGALYDQVIAFYKERGSRVSAICEVVLVRVHSAQPIDSPAYDLGLTEAEVRDQWEHYFQALRTGKTTAATGESLWRGLASRACHPTSL